jgi:membrane protease YdiL (CAAX protease family)
MSDTMSDAVVPEAAPISTANAPALPRPRWGFWSTTAWGLAAIILQGIVTVLVMIAIVVWRDGAAVSAAALDAGMRSAFALSMLTLASLFATLLLLWLATRLARVPFAEYLALKPVGARCMAFALACTLGYGAASDLLSYAVGRGLAVPWVQQIYADGRAGGTLWLLLLAILVAAPIGEEVLFRGFLLRGWAASRLRAPGAIVLASAIWAGMHVQYDWPIIGEIFGLGLLFGYLRVRSGSTVTTIIAHSAYGLVAMVQASRAGRMTRPRRGGAAASRASERVLRG